MPRFLIAVLLSAISIATSAPQSGGPFVEAAALFLAPHFPPALKARVRIFSHVLDESMQSDSGYPPKERLLTLAYDRVAQVVRIDEGNVSFIRRFDLKKEFRIDDGPFPSCRRSYLSEPFPEQQFPRGGRWVSEVAQKCPPPHSSRYCRLWRQEEGMGQASLVYVDYDSYMPLQVVVSSQPIDQANEYSSLDNTAKLEPLLTFTWDNIVLGQPDTGLFSDASEQRDDCERQAGGFPWIHVFHSFFKV